MAEVAITCDTCGTRHIIKGTEWEVRVGAEVWKKQHERDAHDGDHTSAWKIEPA